MKCELIEDYAVTESMVFYERGFGIAEKGKVYLNLYETCFLVESERIECFNNGQKLDFNVLIKLGTKRDKEFIKKYIVFKDLRIRGYVVKSGLKFGSEFRVYEKGNFRKEHSKWIVNVVSERDLYSWNDFSAKNRVAHSTKKKLLIAIVDDELSISYYEVHWLRM